MENVDSDEDVGGEAVPAAVGDDVEEIEDEVEAVEDIDVEVGDEGQQEEDVVDVDDDDVQVSQLWKKL